MTIELKPEHEDILQEALRQGRFPSMEDAIDKAIQSIAPVRKKSRPPGRKSLVELFNESPLKGLSINVERGKDSGRPVDL